MTKTQNDNESQSAPNNSARPGPPVYIYESAGITERKGRVPAWLWIVVASLLVWAAYYLVSYWRAPGLSA